MVIKTKLSEKDYIDVTFVLTFQKLWVRIMLSVLILVTFVPPLIFFFQDGNSHFGDFMGPLIFLLIFPVIIYFSAKRNYKSYKRICENIDYNFERDMLLIKGDSFSSELNWNKMFKVTQTKRWLLIWQSRQLANVIPKRDVSAAEIVVLKDILNNAGVKNNL